MTIHSSRGFSEECLSEINNNLSHWGELIKTNQNLIFTKFGDGELICMRGIYHDSANCDGHPYSKKLGDKLLEAWNFFAKSGTQNVYIGEWANQQTGSIPSKKDPIHLFLDKLLEEAKPYNFKLVNYEILLQNTITEEKYELLKNIKESPREKIFVGPNRLREAMYFLNIHHHVEVPLINSFSQLDNIINKCKNYANNGSIFIISAGMPAKVLIKELLSVNNNISCLDFGSSFDAMFVGSTREGQPEISKLREIYRPLMQYQIPDTETAIARH